MKVKARRLKGAKGRPPNGDRTVVPDEVIARRLDALGPAVRALNPIDQQRLAMTQRAGIPIEILGGRFPETITSRCVEAGQQFRILVERWRRMKCIPDWTKARLPGSGSEEPDPSHAARLTADLANCNRAIRDVDKSGLAMRLVDMIVVCEAMQPTFCDQEYEKARWVLGKALRAIADELRVPGR